MEAESLMFGDALRYLSDSDKSSRVVANLFHSFRDRVQSENLTCPLCEARYIQWGLENLDVEPEENLSMCFEDVFPLIRLSFEGCEYPVPAKYERVLEGVYGDWYELPKDMITHLKHIDRETVDAKMLSTKFGVSNIDAES